MQMWDFPAVHVTQVCFVKHLPWNIQFVISLLSNAITNISYGWPIVIVSMESPNTPIN